MLSDSPRATRNAAFAMLFFTLSAVLFHIAVAFGNGLAALEPKGDLPRGRWFNGVNQEQGIMTSWQFLTALLALGGGIALACYSAASPTARVARPALACAGLGLAYFAVVWLLL